MPFRQHSVSVWVREAHREGESVTNPVLKQTDQDRKGLYSKVEYSDSFLPFFNVHCYAICMFSEPLNIHLPMKVPNDTGKHALFILT